MTHQVRGQLLDASATAVGSAFTISAPEMNAGQAQASLGPDGRGVVAFLAAHGDAGESFDVAAAPLLCE
jgi:hypothetical protein